MDRNTRLGDRNSKATHCTFGANSAQIHNLDFERERDPVFTDDTLAAIRDESLIAGQRNYKCTGWIAENSQGA